MKLLSVLFVTAASAATLFATNAFANDGGIYFLPVEKMQATQESNGVTYTFEGKKAELLRKSLPSVMSVDKEATKNFSALGLYDDASNEGLRIECGDFKTTTKCTIRYLKAFDSEEFSEYFGDSSELTAPVCK